MNGQNHVIDAIGTCIGIIEDFHQKDYVQGKYNRKPQQALAKSHQRKPIFPTDQSLMKMLYLATMNATKKWTSRHRNWDLIKNELSILRDNSSS